MARAAGLTRSRPSLKTRPRGLSVAFKRQEGEPESTAVRVTREIRTPRRGLSDSEGTYEVYRKKKASP